VSSHPAQRRPRPQVAAVTAVGCLVVAAFQAALSLGAPLGAAALGGTVSGALPGSLRLATALTALVWLLGTLVVLARGGLAIYPLTRTVALWGTWVLVGLLGVATLLNFASSSPWERFGWGPYSLTMFALSITLARSRAPADRTPPDWTTGAHHVSTRSQGPRQHRIDGSQHPGCPPTPGRLAP
jgi:hypothetical protein